MLRKTLWVIFSVVILSTSLWAALSLHLDLYFIPLISLIILWVYTAVIYTRRVKTHRNIYFVSTLRISSLIIFVAVIYYIYSLVRFDNLLARLASYSLFTFGLLLAIILFLRVNQGRVLTGDKDDEGLRRRRSLENVISLIWPISYLTFISFLIYSYIFRDAGVWPILPYILKHGFSLGCIIIGGYMMLIFITSHNMRLYYLHLYQIYLSPDERAREYWVFIRALTAMLFFMIIVYGIIFGRIDMVCMVLSFIVTPILFIAQICIMPRRYEKGVEPYNGFRLIFSTLIVSAIIPPIVIGVLVIAPFIILIIRELIFY